MQCPKCDRVMPDNAVACIFCGATFMADAAAKIPVPVVKSSWQVQPGVKTGMRRLCSPGKVLVAIGVIAVLVLLLLLFRTSLELLALQLRGNRQVNSVTGDVIYFPQTWQKVAYSQFSSGNEASAEYAKAKDNYEQNTLAAQVSTETNDYRTLTVDDITGACLRESLTLDQYYERILSATARHCALTGIGIIAGRAGRLRWLKAVRKTPAPSKAVEKLYFVEAGSRKFLLYSLTSSQSQFSRYEHEIDLIACSFVPQPAKPAEEE